MEEPRPLGLVPSYGALLGLMEAPIRQLEAQVRSQQRPMVVLEAGCGRRWPLRVDDLRLEIIGVDMDADALAARTDLARAVVGDLRDRSLLPRHSCDVVYSCFVLEHVDGAEKALENFMYWLRPGGLLVLRIPDPASVYGFAARTLPFWLHVLYKRWIEGQPNAGKPGFDPYPVHYDPVVSRDGIRSFCERRGCQLVEERGSGFHLRGRYAWVRRTACLAAWALSAGRLSWRHNNLTYVIRAPGELLVAPTTRTADVSVRGYASRAAAARSSSA